MHTSFHLVEGFLSNCLTRPQSIALCINNETYSYARLLEKVELVYSQLKPTKRHSVIAIYCTNDVWTYAGILAILISGSAYLPLNPRWPDKRIRQVVDHSGVSQVLSTTELGFLDPELLLVFDDDLSATGGVLKINSGENAYLLYTSGTTGEPKGIMIKHNNLKPFFDFFARNFDFNEKDRFLQAYELSFDVSVFCIFCAWNVGAGVYVIGESKPKHIEVVDCIRNHELTVVSLVPNLLLFLEKYLVQLRFPSVRYSFFSGDKLYQHLAAGWQMAAENTKIFNCYGPTEATIVCSFYPWVETIAAAESVNNIVPIGKLFAGIDYIILDSDKKHSNNASGELCLSGQQIITEYFGQQTRPDSFIDHNGEKFYRTGDIVVLNENNNFIFMGRSDLQVKINGYRVQIPEIELALSHVGFVSAVVSAKYKELDVLIAVVESEQEVHPVTMKTMLADHLPPYMIPFRYFFVDKIPRSLNDKFDYKKIKAMYGADL